MRKGRGVYYTPPPVVNFIIRAIDDILKESFGIEDGLADHNKVTLLDFACGTGTFLLEVFQRVFENIGGADAARADLIVRDHILKNLYGFEYLIAPYTIAHLKLSQFLSDKGHPLRGEDRLQVFLTNTLEPIEPQKNLILPAIAAEAEAAQEVKNRPILVITGNPPYSAVSKNRGHWITDAIEPYKIIDGKPFGERKHWLHDDYVKFIRFAQLKMDAIAEGVVGLITNSSFVDNPTFRGMRQSLLGTFDQIWILNLNGSTRRAEKLQATEDENVFDIEQGVAISIFIKKRGERKIVKYLDEFGSRLEKYLRLATADMNQLPWNDAEPTSPYYLFKPTHSASEEVEYGNFFAIRDMMPVSVTGIVTARDRLTIGFTKDELAETVKKFIAGDDPDLALKDTRGWKSQEARKLLAKTDDWKKSIAVVDYRPFDQRVIAYDRRLVDWGRWDIMPYLLSSNISLNLSRQVRGGSEWRHVLIGEHLFEHTYVSNRTSEIGYCFSSAPRRAGEFLRAISATACRQVSGL